MPYRAIAAVTLIALVAWTLGLPSLINHAYALNVDLFSNTITDSDLSAFADHEIQFENNTAFADGETFTISFVDADGLGDNFDASAIEQDDISSTGAITVLASCGVATPDTIAFNPSTATTFTGEVCGAISAGTTFTIQIGSGVVADQIQNPGTVGSYVVRLAGTGGTPLPDSGDTRVAVIDDVTVTATVETIFEFTIHGVAEGAEVNDDSALHGTTSTTTTATEIPFGVISPNTPKVAAQELRIDTNAYNGFAVTVQADGDLEAGNGAIIDSYVDGDATSTPLGWTSPGGTMGNVNEYGHWGLTSDDDVVSAGGNFWGLGSALYVGDFVTNPVEVFYHNTAVVDTAGMGVGSTTVAYKVEIMELQEAANDYTATLTYVATPVF